MRSLRKAWQAADTAIIVATHMALLVTGITFVVFLLLSVAGRYVAGFSFMFVESASRFLLVWFFLLGAGLALREKGHVGFALLRDALPNRMRRTVQMLAHGCVLAFILLILHGSKEALDVAASHIEPVLGISSLWGMLAVPAGGVLMVYHQLCVVAEDLWGEQGGADSVACEPES